MMYTFDFDGVPTPPPADSYVGVKLLGTNPFPHGVDSVGNLRLHTYYNAWQFNSSVGTPAYLSPGDDAGSVSGARSRYDRMASSLPNGPPPNDYIDQLRTRGNNMTTLLSTGPFRSLNPGDSVNVVFGIMCARKFGTAPASLWGVGGTLDAGGGAEVAKSARRQQSRAISGCAGDRVSS